MASWADEERNRMKRRWRAHESPRVVTTNVMVAYVPLFSPSRARNLLPAILAAGLIHAIGFMMMGPIFRPHDMRPHDLPLTLQLVPPQIPAPSHPAPMPPRPPHRHEPSRPEAAAPAPSKPVPRLVPVAKAGQSHPAVKLENQATRHEPPATSAAASVTPLPQPTTKSAEPAVSASKSAAPASSSDEPVTEARADADYLHNPAPIYPDFAQARGWTGHVQLKVHVLASGHPDRVELQQSCGHKLLDEAAQHAVQGWTFVPAKRGTAPVDSWVSVPIDFKLGQ